MKNTLPLRSFQITRQVFGLCLLSYSLIFLLSTGLFAAERHVPGEYPTIQSAIDASNNSDVVIITPGTYTGTGNKNLDFNGKAITVRSINPDDPCVVAQTVIDCECDGRGFYFHSGEGQSSVLSGLTITKGNIYEDYSRGVGIYCSGSSPMIEKCIITKNNNCCRSSLGSGICCDNNGNPVISHCEISYNSYYYSEDMPEIYGGGIACIESNPVLTDCIIKSNIATIFGGGIYCRSSSPIINKCLVTDNYAYSLMGEGSSGGGIACRDSNLVITDCEIKDNGSNGDGGGIYCEGFNSITHPAISHCVISNNGASDGGGIACNLSAPTLTDCTISNNSAKGSGGGGDFAELGDISDRPILIRCNISQNSTSYGTGTGGGLSYWDANIIDCIFYDNHAAYGGGIRSRQGVINNCIFVDNYASMDGGAIFHDEGLIYNCTIVNNTAGEYGGGTYESWWMQTITNCIIWGNSDSTGTGESAQTDNDGYYVSYSCIGGWTRGGVGNIDADPCFVSKGPDPLQGYYLAHTDTGQAGNSPCIDAGSDSSQSLGMYSKTTRTDQICDYGIVDMGYHYRLIPNPDLNGDAFVDFIDYSILADDWQQAIDPCDPNNGDINKDVQVNIYDLAVLVESWLTCLVTPSTNPEPANHAIDISRFVVLQWQPGEKYESHDIYFGTDFNEVNNADISNSGVYMGNQDTNYWDTNSYDSNGLNFNTTYYWRIGEIAAGCNVKGDVWSFITVPLSPGQAINPTPSNGATSIDLTTDISWIAGDNTTSHNVYFGTVNPPPFKVSQTETTYDTGTMDTNTTYYWRIDEKNGGVITTGDVWRFTTVVLLPGQAGNPTPANEATNVSITQALGWSAGSYATSHDIYFGTTNPPPFKVNQTGTTYDTGIMDACTTYYWQIDEKNTSGTTTGAVWSFTTGSGLISWWKFDEGTGTIAYDSTGNNYNGTISGATWFNDPFCGWCLSFNGTSDYVNVANNAALNITGDITISACVYLVPGNSPNGIISKTPWNGDDIYIPFDFTIDGTFLKLERAGTSGFDMIHSLVPMSMQQWHHVLVRVENKVPDFYLDGILTGKSSTAFTQTPTANSNPLYIGRRANGLYFRGMIYDVRIYNRALTVEEVALLYQMYQPEQASNPNPASEATNIDLATDLSWTAGERVTSHDVYFGTVNPPPFKVNQTGTIYDTGTMDTNTTYYWRIDEKNDTGITTGVLWSFTTLDANLVGWWKFDEGNGTIAYDSAGDHNGQLIGGPTWTAGCIGGALNFDGVDDYVEMGDTVKSHLGTNYTVSAWIKTDTLTGYHQIAAYRDSVTIGSDALLFQLDQADSSVRFIVVDNYHQHTLAATYSNVLTAGNWYHVAGVRSGNNLNIYVNGVSGTPGSGTLGPIKSDNLKIGALLVHGAPVSYFFDGTIDDVRIYNRALTAEEIAIIYGQ